MARGELPGFAVGEDGRSELFELGLRPRCFAGGVLFPESGHGVRLGKTVFVTEGISDVGCDVGDPLVVVGCHGHHQSFVFLAIDVSGESMK